MKTIFYLLSAISLIISSCSESLEKEDKVMTVNGFLSVSEMGITLEHEHIATDFTGAEKVPQPQYEVSKGMDDLSDEIMNVKTFGVKTFLECTPKYLGRDVILLQAISEKSNLNIITNTGYYAAANKKYLPAHAYKESANQLAQRWIEEWKNGIEGTGIKPGFIKLGVGKGPLDSVEQKLIKAGALAHLATGLKLAIHTGGATAANNEHDILTQNGVSPEAQIVVHSQNMAVQDQVLLAKMGVWISLDGISGTEKSIDRYTEYLIELKKENLLSKVLISHDDGWSVTRNNNDQIVFERFGNRKSTPYSPIFEMLIPRLKETGFSQAEIDQLLISNPAEAYKIEKCRLSN